MEQNKKTQATFSQAVYNQLTTYVFQRSYRYISTVASNYISVKRIGNHISSKASHENAGHSSSGLWMQQRWTVETN